MQLQQENQFEKNNLLRKCGLLAHTSAAFLKNCCTEKLFSCLRLVVCSQDCLILMWCFTWNILKLLLGKPPETGSARLGHIPSLPWESQLPLKPCISLQPSDFESNCDSISIFLRFPLRFIKTFVKEGSLPSLTNHLAELSQLDRSSPTAWKKLRYSTTIIWSFLLGLFSGCSPFA